MTRAISVVAGLLDTMAELVHLAALNRAGLIASGNPAPGLLAQYDRALERARQWMGPGEVDAIIAQADQAMREASARWTSSA
jgi:hypothetical protein